MIYLLLIKLEGELKNSDASETMKQESFNIVTTCFHLQQILNVPKGELSVQYYKRNSMLPNRMALSGNPLVKGIISESTRRRHYLGVRTHTTNFSGSDLTRQHCLDL